MAQSLMFLIHLSLGSHIKHSLALQCVLVTSTEETETSPASGHHSLLGEFQVNGRPCVPKIVGSD